MRHLLLQEAVYAVLLVVEQRSPPGRWQRTRYNQRTVRETAGNRAQLVLMVHILRRRRCGVLLTPLFR